MEILLSRVEDAGLVPLGAIDMETGGFRYLPEYLGSHEAAPVSCSLPLQKEPFDAERTSRYFEALLPEGAARRMIARDLEVSPDRYLGILERLGNDCVADLFIGNAPASYDPRYDPIPFETVLETADDAERATASNGEMHLSLAGNQSKTGLAHDPDATVESGWYRPMDGAASTHVLKSEGAFSVLPTLECLCMNAARLCGILTAETGLLSGPEANILMSRRFDRDVYHDSAGGLVVRRRHQEDLGQALGVPTAGESKYAELPGGGFHVMSDFLYDNSSQPILDIQQLARLAFYNYLIGNCDGHLKNWSVLYSRDWRSLRLAPAYDLVSTVRFEKHSREMAMALGGVRGIDDVDTGALERFCSDISLPVASGRKISASILNDFDRALAESAAQIAADREGAEYEADNLRDECAPRLLVLERFASG